LKEITLVDGFEEVFFIFHVFTFNQLQLTAGFFGSGKIITKQINY
jgi:hypothetical protein